MLANALLVDKMQDVVTQVKPWGPALLCCNRIALSRQSLVSALHAANISRTSAAYKLQQLIELRRLEAKLGAVDDAIIRHRTPRIKDTACLDQTLLG